MNRFAKDEKKKKKKKKKRKNIEKGRSKRMEPGGGNWGHVNVVLKTTAQERRPKKGLPKSLETDDWKGT